MLIVLDKLKMLDGRITAIIQPKLGEKGQGRGLSICGARVTVRRLTQI